MEYKISDPIRLIVFMIVGMPISCMAGLLTTIVDTIKSKYRIDWCWPIRVAMNSARIMALIIGKTNDAWLHLSYIADLFEEEELHDLNIN